MSFTNFDESGSTLTPQERSQEAVKILRLIEHSDWEKRVSERAQEFLYEMYDSLELAGTVGCSVKQLWWLREIAQSL